MKMDYKQYGEIRAGMAPGDVIAFGGESFFSRIIRWWTGSPVSHVALVLDDVDEAGDRVVRIIESTTLADDGQKGVRVRRLSDVLRTYKGRAWWLPLSAERRAALNIPAMNKFLLAQVGKGYDYVQCILSGLHVNQPEIMNHWFCSELGAAALERGSALPKLNFELTPERLVQLGIYAPVYFQMLGDWKEIPHVGAIPILAGLRKAA